MRLTFVKQFWTDLVISQSRRDFMNKLDIKTKFVRRSETDPTVATHETLIALRVDLQVIL